MAKPEFARGVRALAAETVSAVLHAGRSLDAALDATRVRLPPAQAREAGLLQELCYGSLRYAIQLDALLKDLLHKPLRERDGDIQALLLIGLYQLLYMRVPAHAAVNLTVAAADELDKSWARNLINAVLRGLQRDEPALRRRIQEDERLRLSHPDWLLAALRAAWPQDVEAVCLANNTHPPMTLRVQLKRQTRADCLRELGGAGLAAHEVAGVDSAVTLETPAPVERVPGFVDGRVSVQDAAAQLAAPWLDAQPGQRVLDACAAPGGKTAHLLERTPDLDLTAVDRDPVRLRRVQENLDRLGLAARIMAGDAARPADWWDGQVYDRILLDAPCSGTGVIRRHPDIKAHRRPEDIAQLAAGQAALLDALWPLLAPEGKLLYVTCSILPQENEQQIQAFLGRTPAAVLLPLPAGIGRARAAGLQILPGEHGSGPGSGLDGFYYACLAKPAT